MKKENIRKILAITLSLVMMISMVVVLAVSGSASESGNIYSLNVADLDVFSNGDRDNGDYEKAGTDNFFTVFYSAKAKLEANEKQFPDGFAGTRRFAFGDKTTVSADQILNAVKIKTEGSAKITLWWASGDNGRQPAIFNPDGSILVQASGASVKNDPYVSTFEIPSAGIYYIGNVGGSNYFYNIEVVDNADGAPLPERANWDAATVGMPTFIATQDNGAGNIVVTMKALIGHDGADELLVHMYNGDELIATKGSVTEKEQHVLTFTPKDSGTYRFVAELLRNGEESHIVNDFEPTVDFKYILSNPYLSSVTSAGGGSIELIWNYVHEAEYYEIYQNGVKIDTTKELSYMASGLTIGETYTYYITAVRGAESTKSEEMSTVASLEAKQTWAFTHYGPSTNKDSNGYLGSVNDEGWVTVYSEGGKGKIQPTSVDGLAFYYTAVPTEYNFTLRAKITVDSWTISNGQEGFGLLATDRLGTNGDTSNIWNNQYFAGSTKIEYRYDADSDQIINISKPDETILKFTMKLGIGSISKTGITKENLPLFEKSDNATINKYFESITTTLERSAANLANEKGTYNIIGNATSEVPGSFGDLHLITEYIMEIQKNNSGYFISYYDLNGNLIAQNKNYDPDALSNLDEDFVYVGFCASRNARATFSDIEFSTILASEDAPREYPPTTYITPSVSVTSGTYTTSSDYELIVDHNVAGSIKVTYKDETLVDGVKLAAEERFKFRINLLDYDENNITVIFTPDPEQWLPEFTELSSENPVYNVHTVLFNRGNYHRKTIYISPSVKPHTAAADGTRENPFDIFTAIENAYPGQTLILMEGTYKLNEALKIQRGMNGTEENPIRLIADPEAKTRPVLDFQGLYAGFTHGGNYWYFYGFDVTGSMNMQKGFQISGSHNVLDQIHAYYNGNTGIQLSRYTGADLYEDWPAYNLILNCTSYCNFDAGFEDADGFAAKLTVGPGNVFDGCIAYNNADDGWDLYAKVETGSIGAVTIRNCISYDNGRVPGYNKTGNGNGFKLGGDSLSGKHVLENSIAWGNLAKGIDSNSCPDIIVKNCISFNNGSHNVALYTNNALDTDFYANGVISFRTTGLDIAENLRGKGSQLGANYNNETTYYWDPANGYCANTLGQKITADMFVSLEFTGWERNADGTINLKGFLEIKDNVPENVSNAKLLGTPSYEITLLPDEECSFGRSWYTLDKTAHWHLCECGNKSMVENHKFIWIIDTPVSGDQPGRKHEECSVCGYKRAAISIYPDVEVEEPDVDVDVQPEPQPEELGFFAKIWQAILNFFRKLFGIKEKAYLPRNNYLV